MRKLWSAHWPRFVLGAASLVAVGLVLCWTWRIWTPRDLSSYRQVTRYSLGKDLWFGRISPGDELDSIIAKAPPHFSERRGPFTCIAYFPGGPVPPGAMPMERLLIVAKDGQLVSASASCCVWCREFFQMDSADRALLSKTYEIKREKDEVIAP